MVKVPSFPNRHHFVKRYPDDGCKIIETLEYYNEITQLPQYYAIIIIYND